MKKIIILLSFTLIIIVVMSVNYINYQKQYNEIKQYNLEFEKNYQKEIYGIDLTTIINKVINNNKKNNVELTEDNRFVNNNTNSINIDIKMIDIDKIYPMETFYNGGIERFVQNYSNILFKCTNIEYHKKTGRVSYLYFEQISK